MCCALFSGVVGFVLNLASFWCNQVRGAPSQLSLSSQLSALAADRFCLRHQSNSATTYAVVGALNKIPLLLLGALLFSNVITDQQWSAPRTYASSCCV